MRVSCTPVITQNFPAPIFLYLMRAMRKVHSHNIQASIAKLRDHFNTVGVWACIMLCKRLHPPFHCTKHVPMVPIMVDLRPPVGAIFTSMLATQPRVEFWADIGRRLEKAERIWEKEEEGGV